MHSFGITGCSIVRELHNVGLPLLVAMALHARFKTSFSNSSRVWTPGQVHCARWMMVRLLDSFRCLICLAVADELRQQRGVIFV